MGPKDSSSKQASLEESRRFLHGVIAEGLSLGLIRPTDLLRHVSAEMLAEDLPASIRAKLFSASLRSGTMTPDLVVEVVGVQALVQHLPLDSMWECIVEVATGVLAESDAERPVAREPRREPKRAAAEPASASETTRGGGASTGAPPPLPPAPPASPRGDERRRKAEPRARVDSLPGITPDNSGIPTPRPPAAVRASDPMLPPELFSGESDGLDGSSDSLPDDPKAFATSEPTRQLVIDDELDEAIFPANWSNPTPPPAPPTTAQRTLRKASDDYVDVVDEPSQVTDPMANMRVAGKDALSDSLDKLEEWGGEDKTEARNVNPRNFR